MLSLPSWNWRFSGLWSTAEEKIFVAAPSDLQIQHVAHVLEVFDRVLHLILLGCEVHLCLSSLVHWSCCGRVSSLLASDVPLDVALFKRFNGVLCVLDLIYRRVRQLV